MLMTNGISENELNIERLENTRPPPQPPHPDRQLYPMFLSTKGRSYHPRHGSNVLRLRCMHCFCYNKVSNPNPDYVAMMVKMTIIFSFR